MNPAPPLINIVDDDDAVRTSVALLATTVGLRVASWKHPQDFLSGFDREAIGAILLDARMPGMSGPTVLDTLRKQGADQPVILLTGHGSIDMCRRVFKAGAFEFLEKPVDDEPLLETLHNAIRAHVRSRERKATDRAARERYALLSEREREVLALVIDGFTNKEIGRALGLSPRTVETHREHITEKLQVQTLAQLIRGYANLVDGTDAG